MVAPHRAFLPCFCTLSEDALHSFFLLGFADGDSRVRPSFSLSLPPL